MISDFSEPDATTMFAEWLTSNETGYQHPLPQLTKSVKQGGVYLGVGPEQNFTYIAAMRPKIAFVIDYRKGGIPVWQTVFHLQNLGTI